MKIYNNISRIRCDVMDWNYLDGSTQCIYVAYPMYSQNTDADTEYIGHIFPGGDVYSRWSYFHCNSDATIWPYNICKEDAE